MKLTLFAALVCLAASAYAQDITKCQLASTLVGLGVSRGEVHQWVCMADAESTRRFNIVGPRNSDGSSDYGIFQINSYWNCDPQDGRRTKNGCRKPCSCRNQEKQD